MKISFQATLLLLLAVLFQNALLAEDYYIMYNPSCMDRLEYAYGFTPDDQHYVKYHIKINATEVIVLEIGLESESPTQSYLDATTVDCGDEILNRQLSERIRNNLDRVFMVRRKDNQYQISRVNMASYFRRDNRGVVYDSWQFSFNHSGGLSPGDVLTDDPSKMLKVTYEGTTQYECTDAYKFRMEFSNSSNYRELFFLPGIGTVEERPNSGSPGDIYKLKNYNDTPFESYLQKMCRNSTASLSSNFLPGSSSSGQMLNGGNQNSSAAGAQYHEVEKGETAYSISRKYNISIENLRTWNPDIQNASLVQVGDRIRVSPPNGSTGMAAETNSGQLPSGGFGWDGASNSSSTSTASLPGNPNNSGSLPGATTSKGQQAHAWNTTDGEHVVQPGETVALLALKYGYTEERFRDMNNLGPNDIFMIGQRVKTTDCPPGNTSSTSNGSSIPGSTNPYNFESSNAAGNPWSSNTQENTSNSQRNSYMNNSNSGATAQGSLPSSSTLPTFNNASSSNSLGTEISPRSPNAMLPATGAAAASQRSAADSSFEPYGTSGPDFSSLPQADENTYNANPYAPNSGMSGQGVYPNTDAANTAPGNTQPNYYNNNRSLPTTQPPAGNTSSGFGTPIPSSGAMPGANNYPAGNNQTPAARSSDPFSSSYYSPEENSSRTSDASQTIHIVREGDTLESIARKYNTTAEQLRQLNNLERTEVLIPYQKLYID